MAQPDNWGWQARIGMFIVSAEAVPEAEWWAMAPSGVSVHAARVTAQTPWARWNTDRTNVKLEPDVERGIKQFASMRLSAIVIGHSSSSIIGGKDWDNAIVQALSEFVPSEVAITTNGLDCQAAMRASGVSHPFLVFPAWFGDSVLPQGVKYFASSDINPIGHMRFDPGRQWRDLPPNELYANGMGFEQDIEALYRQIRASCPPEADGIVIAGTGFRCVGIIDALERDLGKPVIAANQASLWHCLQLSGVRSPIAGYGNLFSLQND